MIWTDGYTNDKIYVGKTIRSMMGTSGYIYNIEPDNINPIIQIRWEDPNSPDTIVRYLECKHLL